MVYFARAKPCASISPKVAKMTTEEVVVTEVVAEIGVGVEEEVVNEEEVVVALIVSSKSFI